MAYTLYKNMVSTQNFTKGHNGRVNLVYHYTGNATDTAKANANYFWKTYRGASAHYFVDDTTVYLVVDEANTSWALGVNYGDASKNLFNTVKNNNTINIEMCSKNGKISDATFANAVALGKDLMKRYNIPISRVYRHYDVCTKSCPGWSGWLGSNPTLWNKLKAELVASTNTATTTVPVDGYIIGGGVSQSQVDKTGKVTYKVHMRGIGDGKKVCDGMMAGSTGQNRRIEGLYIWPVGQMDVTVHIKDIGDKKYSNITGSTLIGTSGQSKRIEAITINSTDTLYVYRVHIKNKGWTKWYTNGQMAGTTGQSLQIEAIEIKVAYIGYKGHVQGDGWQGMVADGETAGTTNQSKRMEALMIDPCGLVIEAWAHIQDEGWVSYGKIDKNTVIGTTNKSKRLEALKFKGDFEYRVHVQGVGWTAWTDADGIITMGTAGQGLRLEAIQMRKKAA
ncbi:MAG: N-acetylmuramoyl-L-alanine amidase [Lachnospiraceae bacterium]